MHNESIFKVGVSSGIIAEICLLGAIVAAALAEYDEIFIETVGVSMTTLSAAIGITTLLLSLYALLKWKQR